MNRPLQVTETGDRCVYRITPFQSLSPFSYPKAETRSHWAANELIWTINGEQVTDKELRSWCYIHLQYPWCYADVIRQYHCNAWAVRNTILAD